MISVPSRLVLRAYHTRNFGPSQLLYPLKRNSITREHPAIASKLDQNARSVLCSLLTLSGNGRRNVQQSILRLWNDRIPPLHEQITQYVIHLFELRSERNMPCVFIWKISFGNKFIIKYYLNILGYFFSKQESEKVHHCYLVLMANDEMP